MDPEDLTNNIKFYFLILNEKLLSDKDTNINTLIEFRNVIHNLSCNFRDKSFISHINCNNLFIKFTIFNFMCKISEFLLSYINNNAKKHILDRNYNSNGI